MSEGKHTPWEARGRLTGFWVVWDRHEVVIASNLSETHAHLIAAAPDLLEALKRSREWAWEDFEGSIEQFEEHPEVRAIDAAIAKAEGQAE